MTAPLALAGVSDLASRAEVFFLDQFGVLHDGVAPYPGAVEALSRLRRAGKRIVILSNSGKRSAANAARLVKLGFDPASWDVFLSSGEVAWAQLRADGGADARRRCLVISRGEDGGALDGLDLDPVTDGRAADFVLIAGSDAERFGLDHYRALLAPAAARGAPCLCTNPDRVMLVPGGSAPGAGALAELYEQLGGSVRWIGKPYPAIYAAALAHLGSPDPASVICVGDSVEHDIAGGRAAGLRTALVRTGIHAGLSDGALALEYAHYRAVPDFIVPGFAWGG